jgi:DNA mismatch endonuclease Vsr
MDRLTKEQRSKNMKAIKNKNSKIELILGKSLWSKGLRYRKNDKSIYGKPDFSIKKLKIAIFCDSEFWHGKNWAIRKFDLKSNKEFWINKIEKNIQRDILVNETLSKEGWIVLRFWGNEILKDKDNCTNIIFEKINNAKGNNKY